MEDAWGGALDALVDGSAAARGGVSDSRSFTDRFVGAAFPSGVGLFLSEGFFFVDMGGILQDTSARGKDVIDKLQHHHSGQRAQVA